MRKRAAKLRAGAVINVRHGEQGGGAMACAQMCGASAETAAMLFWALLASSQITMRKVDGSQTLD